MTHTDGRVIDDESSVQKNVEEVGEQRGGVDGNVDMRLESKH